MKKYLEGFLVGINFFIVTELLQASGKPIADNWLLYTIIPLYIQVVKIAIRIDRDIKKERGMND